MSCPLVRARCVSRFLDSIGRRNIYSCTLSNDTPGGDTRHAHPAVSAASPLLLALRSSILARPRLLGDTARSPLAAAALTAALAAALAALAGLGLGTLVEVLSVEGRVGIVGLVLAQVGLAELAVLGLAVGLATFALAAALALAAVTLGTPALAARRPTRRVVGAAVEADIELRRALVGLALLPPTQG